MSINMNTLCIQCQLNKYMDSARALDEQKAIPFARDLLEILKNALETSNSSVAGAKINALYKKHFGLEQDRFAQEKKEVRT